MIDHWLGRVLDALDEGDFWEDTMVILCTDHGHYLGEKDLWGKPRVMQYEPLGHTPLLISFPAAAPGEIEALTTNVDLHATLADFFAVSSEHVTHGQSLLPLITGTRRRFENMHWAGSTVIGFRSTMESTNMREGR